MCTILTSLYLSAAFDTIDYVIFLRRLNFPYGVDGVSLNWFKSYFNDRDHKVCVHEALSSPRVIKCGVPQGSVLGTRLYTMYILASITTNSNYTTSSIHYHTYADDA